MGYARRVVRQRSGVATVWLVLLILTNAFWEWSLITQSHLQALVPEEYQISPTQLSLQALLCAASMVAAIGLLNWQKWALVVYLAANGLMILSLLLSRQFGQILAILIGTAITFAALNANSPQSVLRQLE